MPKFLSRKHGLHHGYWKHQANLWFLSHTVQPGLHLWKLQPIAKKMVVEHKLGLMERGCIGRVHWYQDSFLQGHIYWKSVTKYSPLPKKIDITKLENKTLTFDATQKIGYYKMRDYLNAGTWAKSLGHPINISFVFLSPFEVHWIICIFWAFPQQPVSSIDTLNVMFRMLCFLFQEVLLLLAT